ncbi:MAG TPA: glycosyltransferase family 4 protein [Mycobacteriales bacterium]|nr:glycosyltransferase family 4 protein [Mycobacteriales bacterium]
MCETPISGGGERYLLGLAEEMTALGHRVTLVGSVPGWEDLALERIPVPLGPKWAGRHTFKVLHRLPRERRATERATRSLGATVFHAQYKREQIGLTPILARLAPVVWTEHGRWVSGIEGALLAKAYRRASRHVTTLIAVSPAVADDLRQVVGVTCPIAVIPNAVDTSRYRPSTAAEQHAAREALGLMPDKPVVAWVGRMDPGKLPELAIAAGAAFDGQLVMAGSGPLSDQVGAAAAQAGVIYLGRVPESLLLFRASDALLLTSRGRGEGLPYTLLEAAASGLPIVANSGCGLDSGEPDYPVQFATPTGSALSAALTQVISDSSFSERSRSWALRHDVVAWRREHEEVLRAAERRAAR